MRYFKRSDFNCQETGENEMNEDFLIKLDDLRHECGFPFFITSGYRDKTHSIEAAKKNPGTHAQGIAADIKVNSGAEAFAILEKAPAMGFTGIGLHHNFVHLDIRKSVPVAWCY
jgi:uncharacterized protein YcbK (DUF882 family)